MASPQTSLVGKLKTFIRRKISPKYNFDIQYSNNKWDGLRELYELSRYSVITGYVRYFCNGGSIADLGCGEGVLQQRFTPSDYSNYLGIDFSDVAIVNAKKLEDNKTRFMVGDLNQLRLEGIFDAIISNESLYYLSNPVDAVRSLFQNLKPGGIFIISMVNKDGEENHPLWMKLDEHLQCIDKTITSNNGVRSWTIKVFKIRQS